MLLCMSDGRGLCPLLSPQTSHGSGNQVVLTGKSTRNCSSCGAEASDAAVPRPAGVLSLDLQEVPEPQSCLDQRALD